MVVSNNINWAFWPLSLGANNLKTTIFIVLREKKDKNVKINLSLQHTYDNRGKLSFNSIESNNMCKLFVKFEVKILESVEIMDENHLRIFIMNTPYLGKETYFTFKMFQV